MTHKNIAVGMFPEGDPNLVVTVEWNPGESKYTVTFLTAEGNPMTGHKYFCEEKDPIEYEPGSVGLSDLVFWGLDPVVNLMARLVRGLVGFGHIEWFNPAAMDRATRAKFGADA